MFKEHVFWLPSPLSAVLQVKHQIVLQNVIALGKSQFPGSPVNRLRGALEFNKRPYRRLVQLDQESLAPLLLGRERECGSVAFIPEPTDQPQAFKNLRQAGPVGHPDFHFFSDTVSRSSPAIQIVASGNWPFEGHQHVLLHGLPAGRSHEPLGSYPQQLAFSCQSALRGVKEHVVLPQAFPSRMDRARTASFQRLTQCALIANPQFDFTFAHRPISTPTCAANCSLPSALSIMPY